MNNIFQGKKVMAERTVRTVPVNERSRPEVDSQVLQEIIDILKHPFQNTCKVCNGMGFVRDGDDCHTCHGTGKVLTKPSGSF